MLSIQVFAVVSALILCPFETTAKVIQQEQTGDSDLLIAYL